MTLTGGAVFAQNVKIILIVSDCYNPDAELVLLKNDNPCLISAKFFSSDNEEMQIVKLTQSEWQTSVGKIAKGEDGITAVWKPLSDGATASITAKFSATLEIKGKKEKIENLSAVVNVISPVSYKKHYQNGKILQYEIGEYLDPKDEKSLRKFNITTNFHKKYPEKFMPPEYFYIITKENKSLKISEHYFLGDYALDFPWHSMGLPQAVALDYGLFEKLEELQTMMNKDGYRFDKFEILYGFRAPAFNLGTIISDSESTLKVPFSQHQFGKAIDILIDTNKDLKMDDLNKDGKVNMRDAAVILHYVNILDKKYREAKDPKMGGAGLYSHHDFTGRIQSPYIHIDTRNFATDKGYLIRWPSEYEDGSSIDHGNI